VSGAPSVSEGIGLTGITLGSLPLSVVFPRRSASGRWPGGRQPARLFRVL